MRHGGPPSIRHADFRARQKSQGRCRLLIYRRLPVDMWELISGIMEVAALWFEDEANRFTTVACLKETINEI